jgi:hypothetical protein
VIDVYVRELKDIEAMRLGEFTPEELPLLIKSFRKYPTYMEDTDVEIPAGNDVFGQYVHSSSKGVYFEIVVADSKQTKATPKEEPKADLTNDNEDYISRFNEHLDRVRRRR